jgi:hypothetical protein
MRWLNYSRFPRLNWRVLFILRTIHLKTRMLQIYELLVRVSPTSSFWREENRTLTEWRLHGPHGEVPRGGAASFRRRASAAATEVLPSLFSRSGSLSPISRLPPAFRLTFDSLLQAAPVEAHRRGAGRSHRRQVPAPGVAPPPRFICWGGICLGKRDEFVLHSAFLSVFPNLNYCVGCRELEFSWAVFLFLLENFDCRSSKHMLGIKF